MRTSPLAKSAATGALAGVLAAALADALAAALAGAAAVGCCARAGPARAKVANRIEKVAVMVCFSGTGW